MIAAGVMVVDAVYFNMVGRAPYWYTQSELTVVVEVRQVLRSGLQLEEISPTNKLPLACNRLDATRKRAVKITTQEHQSIMEEAVRRDRLELSEDEDSDDVEDDESGIKVESDGDDDSLTKKNCIFNRRRRSAAAAAAVADNGDRRRWPRTAGGTTRRCLPPPPPPPTGGRRRGAAAEAAAEDSGGGGIYELTM